MFEKFLELDAGQAFDDRRQLADDGRHIAGELARAAAGAVAGVDDDHLLGLGQRLADLARDVRQHAHDHFDDGGLVVLLEGFRLHAHRFGSRFTLRLDDGSFGQTARFVRIGFGQTGRFHDIRAGKTRGLGRGRRTSSFGFELEFFCVRQRLDLVALGIGGLLHAGFEFALLAKNFLLLQFDLFLLLDDLHLDFFRLHELAGLELLQIIREVGLRLLHVHRGLILGDIGLIITLRLGDFRVGLKLCFLSGLIRLRRTDLCVAVCFGLRDDGIAFHLRDARFTERIEITLPVADIADGKTHNTEAHVRHVAGGNFLHLGRERIAVLINFFHGHRPENRAQVTFQRLHGDALDIFRALAQELFRCRGDGNVIALDLDLRHAVHANRHAFACVNFRRLHINRQQFEREHIHFFKHRPHEAAAALDHAETDLARFAAGIGDRPFATGNDQHFVRAGFLVSARVDDCEDEHDKQDGADGHHDGHHGKLS